MKQLITKLKFESLEDKELTVINGIFKLFEILCLDKKQKENVINYLKKRLKYDG